MNPPRWPFLVLAGLGAGVLLGRALTPPDVREVERVVYREHVVTQTVREAAEVRTRVVYRDRVRTPDGAVREREVERDESATVAVEQAQRVEVRDVERVTERTVTAPRPSWRVGALAGVPLQWPPVPLVGVSVERRLFGPVSAGAWALVPTSPDASAAVGLSVAVEF